MKKVILAYSGGLDTTACIPWLKDRGYEVVAFIADVGQSKALRPVLVRARKAGASRVIVRDLKRSFITGFIWPALKANAVYEGRYLLATSLSRPLIARELVRIAHEEKADWVAHGCTGKGNDQVRFELSVQVLDPRLRILAPLREWELKSREEEISYVRKRGIPIDVHPKNPYSIDENLWGVSIECGPLEDPWHPPPEDCYVWTRLFSRRQLKPIEMVIDFQKGIPVGIQGKRKDPVRLVQTLNQKASSYGVGRMDMVENRLIGIKSREIYEAPAASILHAAHRDLEALTLDRALYQFKEELIPIYARLIYNGLWFTRLKRSLDAFMDESQKQVTGSVRVRLSKGSFAIVGRRSPHSLYQMRLATYSKESLFDEKSARGFIDLFSMPFRGLGDSP